MGLQGPFRDSFMCHLAQCGFAWPWRFSSIATNRTTPLTVWRSPALTSRLVHSSGQNRRQLDILASTITEDVDQGTSLRATSMICQEWAAELCWSRSRRCITFCFPNKLLLAKPVLPCSCLFLPLSHGRGLSEQPSRYMSERLCLML